MKIQAISSKNYTNLLDKIAGILVEARKKVIREINKSQVLAYWEIGREIVEFEQKGKTRAEYGEELIKKLSKDMTERFGKGFSKSNIFLMRQFYLTYPEKFQTVSGKSLMTQKFPTSSGKSKPFFKSAIHQTPAVVFEPILSWSNYCELLSIEDDKARLFYQIESYKNNWSVRELRRQINSLLFERLALSKDKKKVLELVRKGQVIEKPEDAIKNPYVLEFLGIPERSYYTETQLEQKLIDHLHDFILELGKRFSFIGRQKRITIENEHYYIDLVFYHRILKCMVLIDLKIGTLSHADVGQMNFYLNYIKDREMLDGENPPIGIILCTKRNKSKVFVEYALGGLSNKIFVSKYKLYLPTKHQLEEEMRKEKKSLDL